MPKTVSSASSSEEVFGLAVLALDGIALGVVLGHVHVLVVDDVQVSAGRAGQRDDARDLAPALLGDARGEHAAQGVAHDHDALRVHARLRGQGLDGQLRVVEHLLARGHGVDLLLGVGVAVGIGALVVADGGDAPLRQAVGPGPRRDSSRRWPRCGRSRPSRGRARRRAPAPSASAGRVTRAFRGVSVPSPRVISISVTPSGTATS